MASNKKSGTAFERRFARFLSNMGFWVHLMTQNDAGQPADIIAVKNGKAVIVDCKVCEKGYFRLDRMEENQQSAMTLWKECGNGSGWFALELPTGLVRLFSLQQLMDMSYIKTVLPREDIERGMSVDEWVKQWKGPFLTASM